MEPGRLAVTGEFPGSDVAVVLVIAKRFVLFRLVLFTEVSTAGFVSFERVDAHQLRELEEVGNPAGAFEHLVECAGHVTARYRTVKTIAMRPL